MMEVAFNPFLSSMLFTLAICSLTYSISRILWEIEVRKSYSLEPKFPPTNPYTIPFLGNLPSIVLNTKKFIHHSTLVLLLFELSPT
jgi:hypothetical protein